jgi:8-oxo-dGTP pyrophosphatase MutT (NUDIX family)
MPAEASQRVTTPVAARDAASLAIVDTIAGRHFVLVGKRQANQTFIPGKYVLPGGAVELADAELAAISGAIDGTLLPDDVARLLKDVGPTAPCPVTLGLGAVRETFEETGRMVGRSWAAASADRGDREELPWPSAWQSFQQAQIRPSLLRFSLLARAVTPPDLPRRYDARFFHVPAQEIAAQIGDGDGEFERVEWMALSAALALDLHGVTRAVLVQLDHRLTATGDIKPNAHVPYMHAKSGSWTIETL